MSARAPRGFRFPETGDLDAEDRTRHRRDRVATAAGDGWVLDCSAAAGGAISAALSQAAGTLDVAS